MLKRWALLEDIVVYNDSDLPSTEGLAR